MATMVLTTVGTLVAGPVGGAIGALVGQQIDQNLLFRPKARHGPRLGDLAIQTSSYGNAIPRLFGAMRVAGTVIWATDLKETRSRSGGGKGRPSTTSYSYSASFAVALSARPIREVRRIWADGKLLRGAAGDFKVATGFRLHNGEEGQPVDPLIAAVEGVTPAYRGIAYAVFEDLQLADYGNRIPSLSFEVVADGGAVSIGAIARTLSEGAVIGDVDGTLIGYAASGDSVRSAIETIGHAAALSLADRGEQLWLGSGEMMPLAIPARSLGAAAGEAEASRRHARQGSALAAPMELSLGYYEPARDYQAGLHRATRPGDGRRGERIELPAALDAQDAKAITEAALRRAWDARVTRTLHLPWRHMGVAPAAIVTIEGEPGLWRVSERQIERMAVVLTLVRHRDEGAPLRPAEPGRPITERDQLHGPTLLRCFELPELGEALATAPRLFVAAAGSSAGWRSAALAISHDSGTSWQEVGATAAPATMGVAQNALGATQTDCFDDIATVDVALAHDAMMLSDADDARLLAGANLALLGEELIQFGRAEPIGPQHYRLSRLLRGRRGTDYAMHGHIAGEHFVLIEAETLLPIDLPGSALGGTVHMMASGIGDISAVLRSIAIPGVSVRPPAPAAFQATPDGSGGFILTWIRRSRLGWRWIDGVDAPLGEERELYRLTVSRGGEAIRVVEASAAMLSYPASMIASDAAGQQMLTLSLAQIGTLAPSASATIVITAT